MKILNGVALVTGANRGLGKAFVEALLAAGAKKIYATAREPHTIPSHERVVPLRLDVTKWEEIQGIAVQCRDVNILINNAGIVQPTSSLLDPKSLDAAHDELDTMFFAPLGLSQAFAPILAANGGGAIINVLSALSWISMPGLATYSAVKSALWSLTNGLRHELRGQGTHVLGLHVGYMDTDMAGGLSAPKISPNDVARKTLIGLEQDLAEVLADETSVMLKQGLAAGYYLQPPV